MWAPLARSGFLRVTTRRVPLSPGLAEDRRQGVALAAGHGQHPGELRLDHEHALVRRLLLVVVAHGGDQALAGAQPAGQVVGEPARVGQGHHLVDVGLGGALAAAGRLTNQDGIEAGRVGGGVGDRMRSGTDGVAEGGQEADQEPGRVGLGVRLQEPDSIAGQAVEGGRVELRPSRLALFPVATKAI